MRRRLVHGLIAGILAFQVTPGHADELEASFQSPPMEARPKLRWWWPGDAVEDKELRREIRLMADTGFGGAEIQALMPNFVTLTPDEKRRVDDYAQPQFFAHVRTALEAAREHGMSLDYTMGSSWPSGGGFAITPELAFTELTMARTEVRGGKPGPVKVTIPQRTRKLGALSSFDPRVKDPRVADWGKRMDARARTVAVIAIKGLAPELEASQAGPMGLTLSPWRDVVISGKLDTSSRLILTEKLRDDGTLDWTPPPGEWQVFVFRQYAVDMGVLGAAGQGPQLTLDHMNPQAFGAHTARVGDPLGKGTAGLRSTFVDSLELMQDIHWGPQFLGEFKRRRGYDLTPHLPFVLQPGWMQAWNEHWSAPYFEASGSDTAERVRTDYRRTVSELMIDGFIRPFVDWNRARGLKAKFQAHGGAFDVIRGYGLADIPETEDLPGNGDPLFMRFARSGAHLYGRPLVSAEALAWKDRAYEVTPDEMRKRIDVLIGGGVNSMILHGYNYRFHADEWPGWHAFQPSPLSGGFSSMLNETNPVWPGMKSLATYIGRLQSVMQQGEAIVPVAYFYGRYGYYVGIEDEGQGKQAAEKVFLAGGYDFDRINPDSIANARVERRQLVSIGGQRYAALVLPPKENIRAETAEAIARFVRAGLPVFFLDRAPDRDEGLADAHRRDARVRRAVAAALKAGAKVVPSAGIIETLRAADVPGNLSFGSDSADVVFVQRRIEGRVATFVVNRRDTRREVQLTLPGAGSVSRWYAMDGKISPLTAMVEKSGMQVNLSLLAGEGALLVLDPKGAPAIVPEPVVTGRFEIPAAGWRLRVEGHASRRPYAQSFAAASLADWRSVNELAQFSGTATYSRSITIDQAWLDQGTKLVLDLGKAHDIAMVNVNGHILQPLVTLPFRIDVTGLLRAGANDLTITISNVPQNGMIDPKNSVYRKLRPLPAGWIGPAYLEVQR